MATDNGSASKAPLLLFVAFPLEGHFNPVRIIASHLSKKGYEVAFLATQAMKSKVEEIGAEWLDFPDHFSAEAIIRMQQVWSTCAGFARDTAQIIDLFLDTLPERVQRLAEVLEILHIRDPSRQIIFVEDIYNLSMLPYKYGRPLPNGLDEFPKSLGINLSPLFVDSEDTGPSILCLPPDSTMSGKLRNRALSKLLMEGPLKPLMDAWINVLKDVGCTHFPQEDFFSAHYAAHQIVIQLCSPSLEYPRSDLPTSIQFVGVLPRQEIEHFNYPTWWSDVTSSKTEGRKILFVTQGTINLDYSELVIPTMKAFDGRDDVLVVVALGVHGGTLRGNVEVPTNVRILDYLPYDLILEFTDVFVSNAGYGAFTHAIRNGVPTVLAGKTEEKAETTMRAVYAGVGVSLETQTPTPEKVRAGVEEILRDTNYKTRAIELKEENIALDALAGIERRIEELID